MIYKFIDNNGSEITALTLDMSNAGAATFNSSVTASGGFLGGSNGGIRIHSGGTKFFNITEANAARDNIMDIGASDARFKDIYLGGNVYLGGTGSANALDDYEEGTWTPTVNDGTISGAGGHYTKIGRVVTVSYYYNLTISYINLGLLTSADLDNYIKLEEWINFKPKTSVKEGISKFVDWYKSYYEIQ